MLCELATRQRRGYVIKLALAFAATYLLWGSTYPAIRYSVETIPPLVTAAIRFSVAGCILFAWTWRRGFRPKREHWIAGTIAGALFFLVSHGILYWAEQTVASGLAAVLIATEPMFILVLGWLAGQQKISRLSLLGLGIGVLGVGLLTGADLAMKNSSLLGLAAVLLGSVSWAAAVVLSPKLHLPEEPLARTAIPLLCGAVLLLIGAGVSGELHRDPVVGYFPALRSGAGISDYLWLRGGIHGLHLVATTVPTDSGHDARVCQSGSRVASGMAVHLRTADRARRVGVPRDSWSNSADPARRTDEGHALRGRVTDGGGPP